MTYLSQEKMSASELSKRAGICFDNGEFEEAIKSWEELLKCKYDQTVILRMAAVAWHQCKNESMSLDFLKRLTPADRDGRKCKWFTKALYNELCELVEKYGRLGMKEAAFSIYFVLRENSFFSFGSDGTLDELYSRELSSPSIQLLRQKLRILREKVFRLAERDSALGKMLKSAKGRFDKSDDGQQEFVDSDSENEFDASDSDDIESEEWDDDYDDEDYEDDFEVTDSLPRLEKEVQILQWIEKTILEKEQEWVTTSSVSEYMKFFNDRKIIEHLEELLSEVEPVLDKFSDYSEKSVSEVKDFLGSFLPGSIRDKVCNDDYLDVVRLENGLERKLLLFIRYCYR